MTDDPTIRIARAYNFAARKHVHHRRKGEAEEPYMNHLTEVAELVAEALGGADIDVVIAAVLHDTVEDTDATLEELSLAFGPRVAGFVAEMTDDKSLPPNRRKELQVRHAPHASTGARIIKLADKTSNLRSLAVSPPRDWTKDRREAYLAWSGRVVDGCRSANEWLAAQFDAAAERLSEKSCDQIALSDLAFKLDGPDR